MAIKTCRGRRPAKSAFSKVVLLILDGWGIGREDAGNAIHLAKTPYIDSLYRHYRYGRLCASGKCVGLPHNQVGNSEAGHMNLGAGRTVNQDSIKISKQVSTGEFFKNPAFVAAIKHHRKFGGAVHIMGLLSNDQSPHSDPDHLMALIMLMRKYKVKEVCLHLFTDGRDSPPRSSLKAVESLERFLKPHETIATVMGRFYAMDRKKAWDRTMLAYDAMTGGHKAHKAKSPQEGITRAYNANVTDEFIEPIVIYRRGRMTRRIADNDSVIFFNLRSDRARQLSKPFVQKHFDRDNKGAPKRKEFLNNLLFVAMTDFGPDLDTILTAYPSEDLKGTLTMELKDKKQLYVAETEKFAHVTFFFNGGYPDPVAGEHRIHVPSPKVDSYDKAPAMSTAKIAAKVVSGLKKYDFICANFACPDMVGHTGNLKAGIKAAETCDKYVKKVCQAALKNRAAVLITADHGNLEYMLNLETGEIITEHTANPVPFIIVSRDGVKACRLPGKAALGAVAPTVLALFGLKKGRLMTRKPLF